MNSDPAAEKALFIAIAQNPAILGQMKEVGLRREWFANPTIQTIIEGAMRLYLQSKDVSLLALMSQCNSTIEKWEGIASRWMEAKAADPINWQQYVPSLKEFAILRSVDGVLLDMRECRKRDPHKVSNWLPHFLQRLRSTLEDHADYDPTPSKIWQAGKPTTVVASTGIKTLDDAYRGGLRNGMLAVWVMPTGSGKSRMTYTMAAHGVTQKIRVVAISTEARPFDVVSGALQAIGGFTDYEVEAKHGSDEGRDELLQAAIVALDKYLYVWGRDKGNQEAIEEILYWYKPTHLILDHLLPMASKHANKYQKQHEAIAEFADYLEGACVKHGCTITVFSQLSGENARRFIKNHDLPNAAAFGSAVPEQAASIGIVAMRHWEEHNTLYGRVKKDRIKGLVDTEFMLHHDTETHTFFERG